MDIHEYQAKEILSNYNVQTLKGKLAAKTSEAVAAFNGDMVIFQPREAVINSVKPGLNFCSKCWLVNTI